MDVNSISGFLISSGLILNIVSTVIESINNYILYPIFSDYIEKFRDSFILMFKGKKLKIGDFIIDHFKVISLVILTFFAIKIIVKKIKKC